MTIYIKLWTNKLLSPYSSEAMPKSRVSKLFPYYDLKVLHSESILDAIKQLEVDKRFRMYFSILEGITFRNLCISN